MTGLLVWAQIHWADLLAWVGFGLHATLGVGAMWALWRLLSRNRRPTRTARSGVECGPVRPRRHRGHHRRPRRMPVRHPGQRGTVYRSRAGAR